MPVSDNDPRIAGMLSAMGEGDRCAILALADLLEEEQDKRASVVRSFARELPRIHRVMMYGLEGAGLVVDADQPVAARIDDRGYLGEINCDCWCLYHGDSTDRYGISYMVSRLCRVDEGMGLAYLRAASVYLREMGL